MDSTLNLAADPLAKAQTAVITGFKGLFRKVIDQA